MNTNKDSILWKQDPFHKPLYDISPFTLLDFPERTACILWFAGCNMRCSYCYNPDVVFGKGKISYKQAWDFLLSRKNLLDGVVFSGGECTLHKALIPFAETVSSGGFKIKLDTNGSKPKVVKKLLKNKLVDYVALDFKAPDKKFQTITGSALFKNFVQTLELLIQSAIPFEVRTTVHADLLNTDDLKSMTAILSEIGYTGIYYLQAFQSNTPTIGSLQPPAENLDFPFFKSKIRIIHRS